MRIDKEWLVLTNALLVGFRGTKVYLISAITLPVMVGNYLQQITKDVTFLFVDCLSAYNAILRQPTLNSWKSVTSTYQLMIKFPTEYKVGKVHENQMATRECYIAILEMDDHLQTINIEEQRTVENLLKNLKRYFSTTLGQIKQQGLAPSPAWWFIEHYRLFLKRTKTYLPGAMKTY